MKALIDAHAIDPTVLAVAIDKPGCLSDTQDGSTPVDSPPPTPDNDVSAHGFLEGK